MFYDKTKPKTKYYFTYQFVLLLLLLLIIEAYILFFFRVFYYTFITFNFFSNIFKNRVHYSSTIIINKPMMYSECLVI